jgi:uncharacterized membrane protein (Fun14 family)
MAAQEMVKPEAGMFETLKETLRPSTLMKKFNITTSTLWQMAIYFGGGIILGYVLKKYGKYVILCIAFCLGLLLLQQIGIISLTFHPQKFQELFGLEAIDFDEKNVLLCYWEWVKSNVALVLSLSIGFLVGLRIG